jgi:cell shape-determining protein MreC
MYQIFGAQLKMGTRNLEKELQYFTYTDMERGNDMENIHYPALLGLLEELLDRVEQLEKDNQVLKSYAWEQ